MQTRRFEIRRATYGDVDDMAAAHLDSIRSLGARYYPPEIVSAWTALVKPELYVNAMDGGEVFYIAVDTDSGAREVLGFSSHRVDGDEHGVGVYVTGSAGRQGIGSALLRSAEASAVAAGAERLDIDASLAAVDFYTANGFEEVGRGEHDLGAGRTMACVFMRKDLQRM